jgi:sugar phosphate permease
VIVVLALPAAALGLGVLALPVAPHPAAGEPMPMTRYVSRLWRMFVVDGRVLLRIRTLRWLIASASLMAFAAGGFNAWLLDFLVREKAMSRGDATTLLSVAMIGAVLGIIVGGRIADRLRERNLAGRVWTIVLGMAFAIPCTTVSLLVDAGPLLYIAGTANFFFFSWYHAPIAACVDDLAPPSLAVAAQGLVIFTMHLLGTASSSYVVGVVSDQTSLSVAMWVPAAALVLSTLAMLVATRSFANDHIRARSGGPSPGMG